MDALDIINLQIIKLVSEDSPLLNIKRLASQLQVLRTIYDIIIDINIILKMFVLGVMRFRDDLIRSWINFNYVCMYVMFIKCD